MGGMNSTALTHGRRSPQQRFGLEASYQFPWQQRYLTLRGRFEYATLEEPGVASERTVNFQLSTRWRF